MNVRSGSWHRGDRNANLFWKLYENGELDPINLWGSTKHRLAREQFFNGYGHHGHSEQSSG